MSQTRYVDSFKELGTDSSHLFLFGFHYSDFIMGAMVSQIIGVSIVCSTVGSGADQGNHQNSASLAFVKGIPR